MSGRRRRAVEPAPADELARARERLEQARHVKHELSNAAMGVIGYAELIAHAPGPPETVRARAEAIIEQGQRVMGLLQRLSELTRDEDDASASPGQGEEPVPPPIKGPA